MIKLLLNVLFSQNAETIEDNAESSQTKQQQQKNIMNCETPRGGEKRLKTGDKKIQKTDKTLCPGENCAWKINETIKI